MQHRVFLPGLALLLAGSLLLTGCASQYGAQKTKVNYYPQCYQPVAQLRQDENSTGTSTAVGAAGGALLGALIGGLATGKVEGAVAGAAVGGVSGAVAGNIYGKSQARDRDAAYLQAYSRQLGSEAASMNRATAAAKVAAKCYDEQFQLAANQFKAGQITRLDFQDRYNEIRSGLEETSFILNSTATIMAQKDSEYQRALAEQYTAAEPASAKRADTAKRGKRAAGRPASAPGQSNVTAQAEQWKTSREELESTRQDVDSRLNAYQQTVDNLLI